MLVIEAKGGTPILGDAKAGDRNAPLEDLHGVEVARSFEFLRVSLQVALAHARDPLQKEEGHLLR